MGGCHHKLPHFASQLATLGRCGFAWRVVLAATPRLQARVPARILRVSRHVTGAVFRRPRGIRVHAVSPGPLATRAASGIPEFDELLDKAKAKAPARSLVSIDDVGVATAFLAHDAARLITGETLYIDGGYHIMD